MGPPYLQEYGALTVVPYKLPVSLSVGSCVIIKGTPIDFFINDPQLQVDFYTDMDEDSDIAFRFRVHFGNHVVMNRREFGIWMLEETTDYVPFEDGKQFELCIYVHYNEYEIKVNGIRIYGFVHRIPPSFVKMMQVSRDVSLTSVCVCN
ncbi:PREDICTED: galactoside-binding soluble lectin 13 isoform X4 [Cercocebus atys]|uniref:galactoside-binding soluble lectin 13 isoform X4 n=1 Tax=Cercocebus atys TaxID=9531 RepID=UPI0005F4D998|nr:PREDICTED: galactoside-binding soluble lectin 13 isoform X4 [Cercocebus atys]